MTKKGVLGSLILLPIALITTIVILATFILAVSFLVHTRGVDTSSEAKALTLVSQNSRALNDIFFSDRLILYNGSFSFNEFTLPDSLKRQLTSGTSLSVRESLLVVSELNRVLSSSEGGIPPVFRPFFASIERRFSELYACSDGASFVVLVSGVKGNLFLYDYPAFSWNTTGKLPRAISVSSEQRASSVYPFNQEGIEDGYFVDESLGSGILVATRGKIPC